MRPQGKIIRNDQGHSHRICMATNYEPEWELKEVESPVTPAGKLFPGKDEVEYGQLETSLCVQAAFHAVAGFIKPAVICHLFTSPLTSGHASLRCRACLELLEVSTLRLLPGLTTCVLSAYNAPPLPSLPPTLLTNFQPSDFIRCLFLHETSYKKSTFILFSLCWFRVALTQALSLVPR